MIGFDGEYPAVHPKAKFWRLLVKNCKISAINHSIEKSILLNFVNLSLTCCPRLKPPLFESLVGGSTTVSPHNRKGGVHTMRTCWMKSCPLNYEELQTFMLEAEVIKHIIIMKNWKIAYHLIKCCLEGWSCSIPIREAMKPFHLRSYTIILGWVEKGIFNIFNDSF